MAVSHGGERWDLGERKEPFKELFAYVSGSKK